VFYGRCNQAYVTKLSYQFECWDYNRGTLMPDQQATFVLRRDGSQPDWAMSGDNYPMVYELFKNKQHAGFRYLGINGWTGEDDEEGEPIYLRDQEVTIFLLYTIQEQKAPVEYCSVNPKQKTVVEDSPGNRRYGDFLCLDLMSLGYYNGYHDLTGDYKHSEPPYKPGGYLPYRPRLQ